MPFPKPYANAKTGESWPEGFWYAAGLVIDYINLGLSLLYRGHVSAQTLDKDPVPAMEHRMSTTPDETRELLKQLAAYELSAEEFAALVDVANRRINVTVLIAMICDRVALTIKDTEVETGEVDEQGNPVKTKVSFFEGIQPLAPDLSVLQ